MIVSIKELIEDYEAQGYRRGYAILLARDELAKRKKVMAESARHKRGGSAPSEDHVLEDG